MTATQTREDIGDLAGDPDRVLRPMAASAYLGGAPSVQTLARWRSEGIGPPWVRIGGAIGYQIADLRRWIDSRRVDPAEQNKTGQTTAA